MSLTALLVLMNTARGADRLHRGVSDDDGSSLALGAVTAIIVAQALRAHVRQSREPATRRRSP